jgi:HNH endonuclease
MADPDSTCAVCARPFRPCHLRQRYCSLSCAMRDRRRAESARLEATFWRRFWERVVRRDDGCWLWIGPVSSQGYGRINRVGFPRTKRLHWAHRLSWEHSYGAIPRGQWVLHRCDAPACVRPDHLFVGTARANWRDSDSKGRSARGSRNAAAKLTEGQVAALRAAAPRRRERHVWVQRLGVSRTTVSDILTGRTWRHV